MPQVEISGAVQGLGTPAANLSAKWALEGHVFGKALLTSAKRRVYEDQEGVLGEIDYVNESGHRVPIDISSLRDGYSIFWDEAAKIYRTAAPGSSGTTLPVGTDGYHLVYRSSEPDDIAWEPIDFNVPLAMGHPLATAVLATGAQAYGIQIPVAGNIIGWTLTSDVSCTATVDVKKNTYSGWPTTTSLWGTKPSLTTARKNQVTGLSIAVAAGDMWDVVIDSNDNAKQLILSVKIRRT